MDRMTDDLRMLAQLALSYIIPHAEFSEWLEEVMVTGYGHSLHMQLSQHNFVDKAVLLVTLRGENSGDPSFPQNSYQTPPRAAGSSNGERSGGNECPSKSHQEPTYGNDYPSQSYHTPHPSPRKRSKKVTHSNPSQKKKSRNANNNRDVGLNVPDSIGRDSQEKSASLPLVQGSASQSQDQDSQAYDDSSSSFEMGGSSHKVG